MADVQPSPPAHSAGALDPRGVPPFVAVLQMISGYWVSQAIYVAAKLGLADLLKDGPREVDDLAQATASHPASLYRLLRALTSVGIFSEQAGRRFALTPMADALRNDSFFSVRAMAILNGEEWHWRPWGHLLHSIRTGETAFNHLYGMSEFEYGARHPEAASVFNDAMAVIGNQNTMALAGYDYSGVRTVVDVGGGHGTILHAILKANQELRGIVFDLPSAAEGARQRLAAAGLAERCEAVGGSFLESVPEGAELYLLSRVLHNWDDEQAAMILHNCRRAMPAAGRLMVLDYVIPGENEPFFGKLFDLEMLVTAPGGRERTEAEFRALLAAAGFELTRVFRALSGVSRLEATRSDRGSTNV